MNDLLQLKGTLEGRPNPNRPSFRNLPAGKLVEIKQLADIYNQLNEIFDRWNNQNFLPGALFSILYKGIVAKSNRVKGFFSSGKTKSNHSIVGAKFSDTDGDFKKHQHIITHYISLLLLQDTLKNLSLVINYCEKNYNKFISYEDIKQLHENPVLFKSDKLRKNKFVDYIVDSYYIESIFIDENVKGLESTSLVSIYKTSTDTISLLKKLDINVTKSNMLNKHTILLMPDDLFKLKTKAPFLISMATTDLSDLTLDEIANDTSNEYGARLIPEPNNEPIIGVIDTLFDNSVYFSKWVEYKNLLDPNIPITKSDFNHGTAVSSLIVDGPTINPNMNDGCGRFKVRHFGVAGGSQFSSFTILKFIQEIVETNKDIKVWNLSLGSSLEISKNCISPEAAILDDIQYKNDIIFVVSGTNDTNSSGKKRIGAPADSINSIIVNSVDFEKKPASYTRKGPVLSFFNKPDLSYYGGDTGSELKVCLPTGEGLVSGTSFAAPWVTRKVAYLIHVLGLSREVAKALLIDSASGWEKNKYSLTEVGYGVVPINIEDVVKSKEAEIKFIINGTSEKYETYTHNIPVPAINEKHPFVARATLCYFPHCERNQGVDYTSTEFNIKFGRVDNNPKIKSINNDVQDNPSTYVYEETAREYFRKWDNIKHIKESIKERTRNKKAYKNKLWGLKVVKKERDDEQFGKGTNFGLVITLKEIDGVNRISEFISQCTLRGWLVNRVNVEQRIDIYTKAEETIVFDN